MNTQKIIKSTGVVAASTLLSRIMGYIRDMIIARYFGASGLLDGFFVAFRIPNLLRRLLAEGSLTISFIPVYTEYLISKNEEEALKLSQKTLSILIVVLFIFVLIGEIFSSQIVALFAYGFKDPEKIKLTVVLNRMMFPYLFFVGIVAFAMGVLNSHRYFFAPSFSPVLLNIGFIAGAVVLSGYFEEPLYGLAAGVILGGIMQLLLQIPYLVKSGFRFRFSIDFKHPGIRKIFKLILPAVFGIAIYQINVLVSTMLASMLPSGSISYLYYSDRLTEIVLGIFIISIGNVILPEMSRMSASEDFEKLKSLFIISIRSALFLAIPSAIALIVAGFPIISVLFLRGKFSVYHAEMTYRALALSSLGIASISILRISTPTFYSLKDTKTPVICSGVSFLVNLVCGIILMQTPLLHAGLALAGAIAVTVQVSLLLYLLNVKMGSINLSQIFLPSLKFLFSGLVMALVIYFISGMTDWYRDEFFVRLLHLILILSAGSAVYFIVCYLLGVTEINYFLQRIFKKGEKNPKNQ